MKLFSVPGFNLDKAEILSSGKRLTLETFTLKTFYEMVGTLGPGLNITCNKLLKERTWAAILIIIIIIIIINNDNIHSFIHSFILFIFPPPPPWRLSEHFCFILFRFSYYITLSKKLRR